MKIAIVGTTAHSILGFRLDLIKALVAKGHEVYAFALDYTAQTKEAVEQLGAVSVPYAFNRAGLNPFVDMMNTFKLAKQFTTYQIEQVFCYFTKPVIFGTFAALLAKVPRRYAMLEGLGFTFTPEQSKPSLKKRLLKNIQVFLYKRALPKLNRFIVLNEYDKKDLIDHYQIKVKDVQVLGPIGLNLQDYPYRLAPIQPVSFLFIGRLLKEKGILDYIQAARMVKVKHPETQFIILGMIDTENPSGLTKAELDTLIKEGTVVYPGFVDNIADYLQHISVFVLPSYYREGIPRSTQEAMATGRAVITTDMPGCKETVIDGKNGFLIPPWSPNKLAEKMCYFIEHPQAIIEMGEQSHQLALQQFDAVKINEHLMSLLDLL